MEKEGLVRAINNLQENGLEINILVTDRHRQIAKWIRETLSNVKHYYDVWHLAKGKIMSIVSKQSSHCKFLL